jgi:hypothetical protein
MNPKKKSRRCRASVSIQALNLAISRFTNSLAQEACAVFHSKEYVSLTYLQPRLIFILNPSKICKDC